MQNSQLRLLTWADVNGDVLRDIAGILDLDAVCKIIYKLVISSSDAVTIGLFTPVDLEGDKDGLREWFNNLNKSISENTKSRYNLIPSHSESDSKSKVVCYLSYHFYPAEKS